MDNVRIGLHAVGTVVGMALLFIPFLLVTAVSLIATGIHSLWIYRFGGLEAAARRHAEMANYRKNMFNFD